MKMPRSSTATATVRTALSDEAPSYDPGAFWRMQAVFGKLRAGDAWSTSAAEEPLVRAPRPRVQLGERPAWLGKPKSDAPVATPVNVRPQPTVSRMEPVPSTAAASAAPSAEPSCFSVLGVEEHASETELRRRFRALAKHMHPDRGGSPDEFVAINRAYVSALAALLRR
ncbi:MAG: J domain-containing protein [Myxococcales bacterium]|nr:J domain-containing protein [Myxococcales bacterium]